MMKPHTRKIRTIAAASLVSLALVAAPASADHGANIVAPVVTFIALSALLNQKPHRRHYHGHGYGHYKHYRPHRRHSDSYGYGGYKPHKKYRKHKYRDHGKYRDNRKYRDHGNYAEHRRDDKRKHW